MIDSDARQLASSIAGIGDFGGQDHMRVRQGYAFFESGLRVPHLSGLLDTTRIVRENSKRLKCRNVGTVPRFRQSMPGARYMSFTSVIFELVFGLQTQSGTANLTDDRYNSCHSVSILRSRMRVSTNACLQRRQVRLLQLCAHGSPRQQFVSMLVPTLHRKHETRD
jgi:hypothetical protein